MRLSIGEVTLHTPGLRGWKLLLKAIPQDRITLLGDLTSEAASIVQTGTDNAQPGALQAFAGKALPLIVAVPDMAVALGQATCKLNGKWLTDEQALDLTAGDVVAIVQGLAALPEVAELVEKLKNVLGGTQTQATASAPA